MEQQQQRLVGLLGEYERQCFLLQKAHSAYSIMEDVINSSQHLYDAATVNALNEASNAWLNFTWICNERIRTVRNEILTLLSEPVVADGQ